MSWLKEFMKGLLGEKGNDVQVFLFVVYKAKEGDGPPFTVKYGQIVHIPASLIREDMPVGIWVNDARYYLKPSFIGWDTRLGCVMEVEWPKPDDYAFIAAMRADSSWKDSPIYK